MNHGPLAQANQDRHNFPYVVGCRAVEPHNVWTAVRILGEDSSRAPAVGVEHLLALTRRRHKIEDDLFYADAMATVVVTGSAGKIGSVLTEDAGPHGIVEYDLPEHDMLDLPAL